MTVTWPITPNSTLDPASRPVPFIVERDVTAVSVRFGSRRVEERAYRDGAFVWPYLRSTRDGNLFTLVRESGWPADPKPFVDEQPYIPPPAATQWDTLKEFDFTTLPSQDWAPWGYSTTVLDGYTFKIRSVANGNAVQQRLGEGFFIQTYRLWNEGNTVGGPFLALDPAQLPGYVEDRQHAIIAYAVMAEQAGGVPRYAVGSFQTNTNGDGANGITASTQITGSYVRTGQFSIKPKLLTHLTGSGGLITQANISTPSYALSDMVFGSVRKNRTTGWALYATWNGASLPTLEEMLTTEGTNVATDAGPLDFGIGVGGSGAAGQTACRIKRMRILQLRAA
jgi:hypothetical protein